MNTREITLATLIFLIACGCGPPHHEHPPHSYTTVWDVVEDIDGNVVIVATNERDYNPSNSLDDEPPASFPYGEIIKFDGAGQFQSNREFFGSDALFAVKYYLENSFLVFGGALYPDVTPAGLWMEQYDSSGNLDWHRDLLFEMPLSVWFQEAVAFGSGFVVSGVYGYNIPILLACDHEANVIFYQEFVDIRARETHVVVTSDSGFCMLIRNPTDHLLFLNSTGQLILDLERGIDEPVHWNTITSTPSGTVIVAGDISGGNSFGVREFDLNGVLIRERTFLSGNWNLDRVHVLSDSSFLIVATPENSESGEVYFQKTSSENGILWETVVNIGGENNVKAICELEHGGFLIAGESEIDPYFRDPFVIAIRDDGSLIWHQVRRIE